MISAMAVTFFSRNAKIVSMFMLWVICTYDFLCAVTIMTALYYIAEKLAQRTSYKP